MNQSGVGEYISIFIDNSNPFSGGGGGIRYRNKFYHGSFSSGILGKYCIMDRFSLGVHTNILSWIVFFRGFTQILYY